MKQESKIRTFFVTFGKTMVAMFVIFFGASIAFYLTLPLLNWTVEQFSFEVGNFLAQVFTFSPPVAVAFALTLFLYKKWLRSDLVWVFGFLMTLSFIALLFLASLYRSHGGLYLAVHQCNNVKAAVEHIEIYRDQHGNYPESLPELYDYTDGKEALYPLVISKFSVPLHFGEIMASTAYLDDYGYIKLNGGYSLEFKDPNRKIYKIHNRDEAEEICGVKKFKRNFWDI